MMSEIDLIIYMFPRIVVATICGFIIGWEREIKHKSAGIRTHIIVCVGACIFTSTGLILNPQYHCDPTRIIGQIVTGMGFIGGGIIFRTSDKVIGVTSAAFIWLIASIGVLVGIGYLMASILFTGGLLLALVLLQKFENEIKKKEDSNNKQNDK